MPPKSLIISALVSTDDKTRYLFSDWLKALMHRWTSFISFTGLILIPERFPPQMFNKRTIPEVNIGI